MDTLRKELEEELKLSTEDLRSHAWYHGPVSREVRRAHCHGTHGATMAPSKCPLALFVGPFQTLLMFTCT